MGLSVSDYGCDLILEVLLGRASFPTSLWVALSIQAVDPSWSGTDLDFFEPSDSAYARLEIDLDADMEEVDGGGTTNINDLDWDTPTQEWGKIGFFGLCTAATAGEVVFGGSLTPAFSVSPGGSVQMLAGSIILTVGSITDYGMDS